MVKVPNHYKQGGRASKGKETGAPWKMRRDFLNATIESGLDIAVFESLSATVWSPRNGSDGAGCGVCWGCNVSRYVIVR